MTIDEQKEIIEQVRTATTDAERGAGLLKLTEDYGQVINNLNTITEDRDKIQKECDRYAKLNNELWIQNSAQKQNGEVKNNEIQNNEEQTPPPKNTYADLADAFEEEYNK